ncbi:hypothetical protein HY311_01210 [Candidatus Nomurabacteria bacterium]|nr:hypothetical protein [Candidatus Nomurabacteria bacterium]
MENVPQPFGQKVKHFLGMDFKARKDADRRKELETKLATAKKWLLSSDYSGQRDSSDTGGGSVNSNIVEGYKKEIFDLEKELGELNKN